MIFLIHGLLAYVVITFILGITYALRSAKFRDAEEVNPWELAGDMCLWPLEVFGRIVYGLAIVAIVCAGKRTTKRRM